MTTPWTLVQAGAPSPELIATVGGHPLLAYLLHQRGMREPHAARSFLDPAHYVPSPPGALYGLSTAADLLYNAVKDNRNILVWGDFDVDGQTATSLLVTALRRLAGDRRVRYHVPNRFTESHGIRLPMLQQKLADPDFTPQVILTCDTGITDAAAVALAKEHGLTVIITDHHDLPAEFDGIDPSRDPFCGVTPEAAGRESVRRADAIINPKLQPLGDPLRALPGVGVAYKLVQALYACAGIAGEEQEMLDLVALGIVADVAEQVHDTRYLLQRGLEQLRNTRRIGLLALMNVARLTPAAIDAESIGFQLGPRMNALGRLDDATVAVDLLTTRDPILAGQLAGKMERLNQQRRLLTNQITTVALEMIDQHPELLDFNGLVLNHPSWHAGIVGIVAARLVEQFAKPTVLLLNPPGEAARGSARSTPGVDIGASIAACAPLLLTYGGHPGAAGLSLIPDNIDRFRRELDRQIDLHRIPDAPVGRRVDALLPLNQVTLELAQELQRLAPFGNGNPIPQFVSTNLTLSDDRRLGRDGAHRRLVVADPSGAQAAVLWFNSADSTLPEPPFDLLYTVGVNNYGGEQTLQLNFIAARAAEELPVTIATAPDRLTIHDLRRPDADLSGLPSPDRATWYAEGVRLEATSVAYQPRGHAAGRGLPLVVYSAPPTADVLARLVADAKPDVVYLVGRFTTDDSPKGVLHGVAAMCKYALNRDGRLHLERMAARLGQSNAIIRYALLLLESQGQIALTGWEQGDELRVAPPHPNTPSTPTHSQMEYAQAGDNESSIGYQNLLSEALAEVRAYRRYFLRAAPDQLGLAHTAAAPTAQHDRRKDTP